MAVPCCRFLIGVVRLVSSPFTRLIATGYYDGPTEGLIECGTCRTTYSFHKLDWDDQQDVRVFSISPIMGRGLEELIQNEAVLEPKWPNWVLADEAPGEFGGKVEDLRRSAAPEEFIVVTESLLRQITLWRPVGLGAPRDWVKELILDRAGRSDE